MSSKINNSLKSITIRILDQTGHSEVAQALEDAVRLIVEEHISRGRFPYVNGKYFQFSAESNTDPVALMQDTVRLRQQLEEDGEVIVTLSGELRGGN